jgi:predicted amidohydrolase/Uri superfamily endonuclease
VSAVLTVALLQVEAAGYDQGENLRRGEAACRTAAGLGADIALFPEMWSIGYGFAGGDLERWRAQAVPRDGAFVQRFAALAAELGTAVAITYLETWPGAPRNTVTLFDRRGREALSYAKVHTCDFDQPEASLTPGETFPVATLDTAVGPVEVGAMICFDREFPESARILALDGAELILVPNACPMEDNRTGQLRARAFEDMVAVALANYPASHDDCDGHSVAFHPCVYDSDGASRDTLVVRAGAGEETCLARFDLDELREWRRSEVWGGGHRRPTTYGRLVDDSVAQPFVSPDSDGGPLDARPSDPPAAVTAVNLLYVVAAWVPRRETIVVGALGPVTFARGWHAYVGSARHGRDARVARHQRAAKPLRWQADYLFSRHPATQAWLLDTPQAECELATRLCALGRPEAGPGGAVVVPSEAAGAIVRVVGRFGASDCGCAGHLLFAARLSTLQAAVRTAGGRPPAGGARRSQRRRRA